MSGYGLCAEIWGNPNSLEYGKKLKKKPLYGIKGLCWVYSLYNTEEAIKPSLRTDLFVIETHISVKWLADSQATAAQNKLEVEMEKGCYKKILKL